ncbi:hypothetical protein H1O16_gp433 [Burkholderia phage BcepSaruman]|uniref:Uncharacterized protein n=1 Tax=Burkholderia phage BcepSaruman TaxID=2530032 RepID=A0A4D5ZE33_9CAUD|nr:hypothetical protein H1O16_gp433 [Burkholderia phage BcepSaruman]QBX06846.1 hypothetical protein BcepSaruman_433 [Burkholderia phage BcepSaruman]
MIEVKHDVRDDAVMFGFQWLGVLHAILMPSVDESVRMYQRRMDADKDAISLYWDLSPPEGTDLNCVRCLELELDHTRREVLVVFSRGPDKDRFLSTESEWPEKYQNVFNLILEDNRA